MSLIFYYITERQAQGKMGGTSEKTIKAYRSTSYDNVWAVTTVPAVDLKIVERINIQEDVENI